MQRIGFILRKQPLITHSQRTYKKYNWISKVKGDKRSEGRCFNYFIALFGVINGQRSIRIGSERFSESHKHRKMIAIEITASLKAVSILRDNFYLLGKRPDLVILVDFEFIAGILLVSKGHDESKNQERTISCHWIW